MALEDGPEGERRREDAEEEVGEGQGHDEGVAWVRPQLGGEGQTHMTSEVGGRQYEVESVQ